MYMRPHSCGVREACSDEATDATEGKDSELYPCHPSGRDQAANCCARRYESRRSLAYCHVPRIHRNLEDSCAIISHLRDFAPALRSPKLFTNLPISWMAETTQSVSSTPSYYNYLLYSYKFLPSIVHRISPPVFPDSPIFNRQFTHSSAKS